MLIFVANGVDVATVSLRARGRSAARYLPRLHATEPCLIREPNSDISTYGDWLRSLAEWARKISPNVCVKMQTSSEMSIMQHTFWGPINDRFGRRVPIAIGLVLFVVGSGGCALSTSAPAMIGWRVFRLLGPVRVLSSPAPWSATFAKASAPHRFCQR